jgi:hypothetical protein
VGDDARRHALARRADVGRSRQRHPDADRDPRTVELPHGGDGKDVLIALNFSTGPNADHVDPDGKPNDSVAAKLTNKCKVKRQLSYDRSVGNAHRATSHRRSEARVLEPPTLTGRNGS